MYDTIIKLKIEKAKQRPIKNLSRKYVFETLCVNIESVFIFMLC